MPSLQDYTQQSRYSDPREYAALLADLPVDQSADLANLADVVRNVLVHYRGAGIDFPPERLAEIDNRWVRRILAADRRRFDTPLTAFRPEVDRVVGCCRDFTLLTVSALRAHGVPARSRVGFAAYFEAGFHHDHVITEFWDGERWVFADTQVPSNESWPPFNPLDIALGIDTFATAAQVWTAYRRGDIDVTQFGVGPDLPLRGDWFVRNYVLMELAHRQCDELLLWDIWGVMSLELDGDLGLIDDVASLLLAADGGGDPVGAERGDTAAAERKLAELYATDPRLNPGDRVRCHSPRGVTEDVDLRVQMRVQ